MDWDIGFGWWLGTISILGGGLAIFGVGFNLVSKRVDEFALAIDKSLKTMERTSEEHLNAVSRQITELRGDVRSHEQKFNALALQLVQRVSYIEAFTRRSGGFAEHAATDHKGD